MKMAYWVPLFICSSAVCELILREINPLMVKQYCFASMSLFLSDTHQCHTLLIYLTWDAAECAGNIDGYWAEPYTTRCFRFGFSREHRIIMADITEGLICACPVICKIQPPPEIDWHVKDKVSCLLICACPVICKIQPPPPEIDWHVKDKVSCLLIRKSTSCW